MITTVLDLSLRGALVFLLVWTLDRLLAGCVNASWRRLWWLLVPVAFLAPFHLVTLAAPVAAPIQSAYQTVVDREIAPLTEPWATVQHGPMAGKVVPWLTFVWLLGMAVNYALVIIPTWRVRQSWSRVRLSTDERLLSLLEDCKSLAGVTAPIGLVVSGKIGAPALLGWLRPRILLPTDWAEGSSAGELRAVFLHELAHFKSLDIPLNWLFAAARIIHWFNPLIYLADAAWAAFREEAADESAIRWMNEPTSAAYGEILLKTLGHCAGGSAPSGALAIGETINNLKRRIHMIRNYSTKSNRGWLASLVVLALSAAMALSPTLADVGANDDDAKKAAIDAIQTWLAGIDAGNYAKSWDDASADFKKAVTLDQWIAALKSVSAPDGKMLERKLASALYQNGVPHPNGKMQKGEYVIAQFDSSFENLKYARETVTFQKEADGVWRAAGYYIKPQ